MIVIHPRQRNTTIVCVHCNITMSNNQPPLAGAATRVPPLKLKAKNPFPSYNEGQLEEGGNSKVQQSTKKREKEKNIEDRLRNGWKKFRKDISTPASLVEAKGATINGYPLNDAQVVFLAETFEIRIRDDTHYWYDKESGFFGKMGGITKHHIDPRLKIVGDLDPRSSAGDTGVFVNGREILKEEKKNWNRAGMILDRPHQNHVEEGALQSSSPQPGTYRYMVDPLGNVSDEATGHLLFNWRQKFQEMRNKQVAVGATIVGVALLGGALSGGEEALFGSGGESFYSSDETGATYWDSSGAGYISFDDGSSVHLS